MRSHGDRHPPAAARFFQPEHFIFGTAALGVAGLLFLAASFLFRYTAIATILQLVAAGLLLATVPYTLIGLSLVVERPRHIVYAILGGLAATAILFGLFKGIILLYGPDSEVWRTSWSPLELSAVAELAGFGLLMYSLAGFHLGCWLVYRKLQPRGLPDTERKILDL